MDSVRIAPMLQQRAGTYVWYTQQEEEQQEEQLEIQQQREEHLLPRVYLPSNEQSSTSDQQSKHSSPVVNQPERVEGLSAYSISLISLRIPQNNSNLLTGLESLISTRRLLIKQRDDEVFLCAPKNKFIIQNDWGENIYWAEEESDCCARNCLGTTRPFSMNVMDFSKSRIMHMHRPFAFCSTLSYSNSIEVSSPQGFPIGRVEKVFSVCSQNFVIKDQNNENVLRLEHQWAFFNCGVHEFKITKDGNTVGQILIQLTGCIARKKFTDNDLFEISFSPDLDIRIKAVLLGACFLIDMLMFEKY